MYRIIHLEPTFSRTGNVGGWIQDSTDYEPMTLDEGETVIKDLNRDAIESSLDDRYVLVSVT